MEDENVIENSVLVSLLFDLSSTQSSENIVHYEVIPKHIDTKFTSVSDTKIYTRETFQNLYFDILYSLYPGLFARLDGVMLIDDLFRDEKMVGRKLLTSYELPLIDQFLVYVDK